MDYGIASVHWQIRLLFVLVLFAMPFPFYLLDIFCVAGGRVLTCRYSVVKVLWSFVALGINDRVRLGTCHRVVSFVEAVMHAVMHSYSTLCEAI